jgi:hypothetical protein
MSKLHELLAVDSNLKGQAQKCRTELQNTMEKKPHLFQSKLVTVKSSKDGEPDETREQSEIQSTVRKEVEWLSAILAKSWDASYAIDLANTEAKADVALEDGTILLKAVPATALLQLEKRIREVQEFIVTIKTLDPAKGFLPDANREQGVYKAREVTKAKTEKIQEPLTLAPPTKEHPAQVVLVSKDVKVGTILEQEWSALISPAMKAELIDRVETLFRAITKARSRANEQEVDVKTNKIGKTLLEYVFQPLNA